MLLNKQEKATKPNRIIINKNFCVELKKYYYKIKKETTFPSWAR